MILNLRDKINLECIWFNYKDIQHLAFHQYIFVLK